MDRPAFIDRLEANDVEFLDQVRGLSNVLMTDGALPAKTKTLMTLFAEALLRRDDGVRLMGAVARNVGATEDEIKETVRLAFLLGGLSSLSSATMAYLPPKE